MPGVRRSSFASWSASTPARAGWTAMVRATAPPNTARPARAGARRVLDDAQPVAMRDADDRREIARHADLVHAENRAGSAGDGRCNQRRIDVERAGIDVDEHRYRAAVADRIRRRDEGVADRD